VVGRKKRVSDTEALFRAEEQSSPTAEEAAAQKAYSLARARTAGLSDEQIEQNFGIPKPQKYVQGSNTKHPKHTKG
jgi:hypothetical protein